MLRLGRWCLFPTPYSLLSTTPWPLEAIDWPSSSSMKVRSMIELMDPPSTCYDTRETVAVVHRLVIDVIAEARSTMESDGPAFQSLRHVGNNMNEAQLSLLPLSFVAAWVDTTYAF